MPYPSVSFRPPTSPPLRTEPPTASSSKLRFFRFRTLPCITFEVSQELLSQLASLPPPPPAVLQAPYLHRPWQTLVELLYHAHDHLPTKRVPDEHPREKSELLQQRQHVASRLHHPVGAHGMARQSRGLSVAAQVHEKHLPAREALQEGEW